jgi:hypothetical protein
MGTLPKAPIVGPPPLSMSTLKILWKMQVFDQLDGAELMRSSSGKFFYWGCKFLISPVGKKKIAKSSLTLTIAPRCSCQELASNQKAKKVLPSSQLRITSVAWLLRCLFSTTSNDINHDNNDWRGEGGGGEDGDVNPSKEEVRGWTIQEKMQMMTTTKRMSRRLSRCSFLQELMGDRAPFCAIWRECSMYDGSGR